MQPDSLPLLWFHVHATHKLILVWDGFVWRATLPSLHCSKCLCNAVSSMQGDHLVKLFSCSIYLPPSGSYSMSFGFPSMVPAEAPATPQTWSRLLLSAKTCPVLQSMSLHNPPVKLLVVTCSGYKSAAPGWEEKVPCAAILDDRCKASAFLCCTLNRC